MSQRPWIAWMLVLALELLAAVVLIPNEIARAMAGGSLQISPELADLTFAQWLVAAVMTSAALSIRWLVVSGLVLLTDAFVAGNGSFRTVGAAAIFAFIPLALKEALRALLLLTGLFPPGSTIVLDLSILWPGASPLIRGLLAFAGPFEVWAIWTLTSRLLRQQVYTSARQAWTVSGLALFIPSVLGSMVAI